MYFCWFINFDFFMHVCWFILNTIWKMPCANFIHRIYSRSPFFFRKQQSFISMVGNIVLGIAPKKQKQMLHIGNVFTYISLCSCGHCFTFHVGTVNHPVPWSIMGMHCATESLGNCDILLMAEIRLTSWSAVYPLIYRFCASQVVQEFFQQQYEKHSEKIFQSPVPS